LNADILVLGDFNQVFLHVTGDIEVLLVIKFIQKLLGHLVKLGYFQRDLLFDLVLSTVSHLPRKTYLAIQLVD